jgi:hypothetical protein
MEKTSDKNCYDWRCEREHYYVTEGKYTWRLHFEEDGNEQTSDRSTEVQDDEAQS